MSNRIMPNAENQIYFPELDGLRFFAFFLVFLHHDSLFYYIPQLNFLHNYGWIGVDLFFVLSAFLFTKLLIIEFERFSTINFKKFYLRRIFRIWPLYFLIIILSLSYYLFVVHKNFSNTVALRTFGLFFFSDNILAAILGYIKFPFIAHLWTICYEEQFYIVIPLVILFLARSKKNTKIVFGLITVALMLLIRFLFIEKNVPHPAIWVLPITHFESIVFGIIIGFGRIDLLIKKVSSIVFALLSVIFFVLLTQMPSIDTVSQTMHVSYLLIGLLTSCLLAITLKSNKLKHFLSLKILVYLGKRSYGLYIYHFLAIFIATKINAYFHSENLYFSFLLSLLLTICLTILSYKFIETPFLKLKKKFEMVKSRPI